MMKVKIKTPKGFREDYPDMTNFEMCIKYIMSEHQVVYLGGREGLKKTKATKQRGSGKIIFREEELKYIRENYQHLTNREMSKHLGRTPHVVRNQMYQIGLYKQEMEYWTPEQVEYLKANYREIGDLEIAETFQKRYHKKKGWSKKHIEKKRRYLKLKRTKKELKSIHRRNTEMGRFSECVVKRWKATGQAPNGEIRYWGKGKDNNRIFPVIKVEGKWIHYAPYRWEQLHGPVPKGYNIVFLDGNPRNLDDFNLGKLSNAELYRFNAEKMSIGLGDNYVLGIMTIGRPGLRETIRKDYPQLIEIKRKQLLLNRTINESLRTGSETE